MDYDLGYIDLDEKTLQRIAANSGALAGQQTEYGILIK